VTLAVTGARLMPPGSDTVQVALVLRDVTEEEASRHLRSYFLANITHEFRTPLSALNASIELLMDEAERLSQPGLSELLNSLHLSVSNLQTLIDNLLESSSIEAGRFTVRPRPTDLNRVVADAIRVVQPLLAGRQQSLSLIEPTQLPPIKADPTRLTQVLVNLLSNASKYGPPGAAVDLSLECVENHLRVAVADRGPGIPARERASLFRRFVRLDAQGEEQYGIGLGLAVAKAIVEGHQGQIGVDERPGGGSVFWFLLPLEAEANQQ
jgi:signal transduction histidine kinase